MAKNGWSKYMKYLGVIVSTILVVMQIMNSQYLTEAQKYFVLNLILMAYLIGYVKLF